MDENGREKKDNVTRERKKVKVNRDSSSSWSPCTFLTLSTKSRSDDKILSKTNLFCQE